MTDIYERAAEREEEIRTDALAHQVRRAGLAGKTIADSALERAICDGPIPEARRQAIPGVQTCFDCQFDLEEAIHRGATCPHQQMKELTA